MNSKIVLKFLETEVETKERVIVGKRPIKLKYNGVQKFPGQPDLHLWTILTPWTFRNMQFQYSTRSLDGLKELGIII